MKAGTFLQICRGQSHHRGDRQVLMTHRWSRDELWLELHITASIYWHNYAFGNSQGDKENNNFHIFLSRWMVLASHIKDCFLFWFWHNVKAIFMNIVSFNSIWERLFPCYFPALWSQTMLLEYQPPIVSCLIGLSLPHSLRMTLCLLRKLSRC